MTKFLLPCLFLLLAGCSKNTTPAPTPPPPGHLVVKTLKVNDSTANRASDFFNVKINPVIRVAFNAPVDRSSLASNISFSKNNGGDIGVNISYSAKDSVVEVQPNAPLEYLSKYIFTIHKSAQSTEKGNLAADISINLITQIDSSDKFQRVSDSALLDIVQKQTFKYFWDFGHPVSGMARERNTSGDVVTTGGTGFGVMSIIAAVNRNFISRAQGLARIDTIVNFLINRCTRYHGAFSHWINGATGATIPFSEKDNGGDLVETSFLMQGLLCATTIFQFFRC